MKKIILSLLVALLALPVFSQEHLKFKGVPIDGTLSSFVSALKAKGLSISSLDSKYESTIMEGDFAGLDNCQFMIVSSKDKTPGKVIVLGPSIKSWYNLKGRYNDLKESLQAKYTNAEVKSYEFFKDPYEEGDGYELQAISLDKCIYTTFFVLPEGSITVELAGSTSTSCYVKLTYEDTINFGKIVKENEKSISDDL